VRHLPTHHRSGCAARRAIARRMRRYTTQNPRNESTDAPSRSLMAHEASHFAPKTRERTRATDERTREIDGRTRRGDERTRDLRTNPRGHFVASGRLEVLIFRGFCPAEPFRAGLCRNRSESSCPINRTNPKGAAGGIDRWGSVCYYSYVETGLSRCRRVDGRGLPWGAG